METLAKSGGSFDFTPLQQAALESRCQSLSTPERGLFIGVSAERENSGHCLCQVTATGLVKHWGTPAQLHAVLDQYQR